MDAELALEEAFAPDLARLQQEAHLVALWRAGKHASAELADLFAVARSAVYRAV